MPDSPSHTDSHPKLAPSVRTLALGALGVVYGDLGTSPLYAVRECFDPVHGVPATHANVLGILSLITWALILVVSVKYVAIVMRVDNDGEGGILALLALASKPSAGKNPSRGLRGLVLAALFGASLLYGEGIITPAISVLGAVEGLAVATPMFKPWIVPIAIVVLIALFLVQKRGTAGVGKIFGPVMLLWFAAISAMGVPWVMRVPKVLGALNPMHASQFLAAHGWHGFLLLGSVVLCITGVEALCADMGHFGKRPIRLAWFSVTLPALLINYYGQGAVLLGGGPTAVHNPFFALVSGVWIFPMVFLATAAAVVASQALISGAFSLTHQAVQLGYCPRLKIVHTSNHHEGQIYVPEVNSWLMLACLALVVSFRGSSALAAAYGIAVTGAMTVTSILFFAIMRPRWGLLPALLVLVLFLSVDLSFLAANLIKLQHGGWLPLLVAAILFTVFTTWKRGRRALGDRLRAEALPLGPFLQELATHEYPRVRGNAVFMASNPEAVPPSLLHHLKHSKSLHECVVLLSIITEHVPGVRRRERVTCEDLGQGIHHVIAHFGFMQSPHVPDVLRQVRRMTGLDLDPEETSYFLGRETLIATGASGMLRSRAFLFSFLSRNAHTATEYFDLPAGRVVELGMQIEI